MTHRFNPDHFRKLDDAERKVWQDPDKLIDALDFAGDSIVDIGAGTGFMAVPLAARFPGARVYAIDVSDRLLGILRDKAREAGLTNIETMLTDEGGRIGLPDDTVDLALIINVLHELEGSDGVLTEARRVLKPAGRLVVVDWKKEPTPAGPPVEERVSFEEAVERLAAFGFASGGEMGLYPYHYAAVFGG